MNPSVALTHREAKYVAGVIAGKTRQQAMLDAGFSAWLARRPSEFETPAMKEAISKAMAELADMAIEESLIDAHEIHQYLTSAIRADISDILNDDHSYKPISEWPLIWRQLYEGGDIDVQFASERSHDDEDRDGAGGWDHVGKVVKVKLRFTSKAKLLELAMKHKGIDAFARPAEEPERNLGAITIRWETKEDQQREMRDITPKALP